MQDFELSVDALISQRALKLHFLQIITPGQIYPQRSTSREDQEGADGCCTSRRDTGTQEDGGGGMSPLPSGGHKKKFNVEDFGLSWDNIETMHFFIFPGTKLGINQYSYGLSTYHAPSD